MISVQAVRRFAGSLPEVTDLSTPSALRFEVRGKGFAWSWQERVEPKKPRRSRLDVLAVRCPAEEKDAILSSDSDVFFTDDHYRGFPAVLVRLDRVVETDLQALLTAGQAPSVLGETNGSGERS
ncbi:MmcQ/YjbR family DNA-binding protein [Methylobacterium sp. C25]|uniref:hypothetical protein n=1 Tax=Methylobacterium sp. C25 TaxID=2721622 RepID=UPI001F372FE2|nr:hypothetical protein [Methylobacterium sp. C25]MCE4226860.1 MmcQ/YjbR family DNA-binding protein [Methylobacterium sp. C25]